MPKKSPFPWVSQGVANAAFPHLRRWHIWSFWLLDNLLLRWLRTRSTPRIADRGRAASAGKVASINIGHGIPKRAVDQALVTKWGLAGDSQRVDYIKSWGGHGGLDKAVMLWSVDVIEEVNRDGHQCFPGSSGEQLTLSGVDWSVVKTGARVAVGNSVILEVTYLKGPCASQSPYFVNGVEGRRRISPKRHPHSGRVLAKVLRPGRVWLGDAVCVSEHPEGPQEILMIDN